MVREFFEKLGEVVSVTWPVLFLIAFFSLGGTCSVSIRFNDRNEQSTSASGSGMLTGPTNKKMPSVMPSIEPTGKYVPAPKGYREFCKAQPEEC